MANLLSDDDVFGAGSNSLLSDGDVFGGNPEKKQNKGIAGDLATDLKRGVQGLPGVLTGIGDMIVAPIVGDAVVGKGWDLVGKKTGFQPSKWAKDAGEEYSPSRQAENASINKAWEDNSTPFSDAASGDFSGIGGIAKAYATNPTATAGNVVESIPSIVAGGIGGKAIGIASKLSPVVSGAIGEGAVMGGQQMTNLTDSGVDGRTASAASWGTAAGGAFVGGASGRIAKAAGLADIDTALAGGAVRGVSTEAADKTIRGSIKEAAKRVSGGAATEGLLEELPQSVLEQTLSNLAQGKPWSEGVARSAVEGTLAGSLMGGAFNALPGKKEDAQTNPPSADALPEIAGLLPAPTYTGTPGDQLVSADAERQASIDAAESANAKLWEERDAYENLKQDLAKNNVTITTDPAPIQQRIDALMGINENRLTGKARSNYEKALDIAFNEQIGVVVGENSLEVPFTMGDYLKSKVAASDITRDRPKAESANQQAVDRLGQLNSEESQQQPDIPVVGVLSRIANAGIRSGAIRRDQTAPVVPPEIQSNPVSNNLSPTQKIDLSQRTDGQLSYLSNKGRPGLREAAIAEIQRRGQTNVAKAQPLAQEATQANDAQAGFEQAAAPKSEGVAPTKLSIPPEIVSRIAKRTDNELAFMGRVNRDPVVREAIALEMAIRSDDQNRINNESPAAAKVQDETASQNKEPIKKQTNLASAIERISELSGESVDAVRAMVDSIVMSRGVDAAIKATGKSLVKLEADHAEAMAKKLSEKPIDMVNAVSQPKTDAAPEAKQDKEPVSKPKSRNKIDPDKDSLFVAVAKAGGMDTDELLSNGIDSNDITYETSAKVKKDGQLGKKRRMPISFGFALPLHKKGGMSFDGMREAMQQYGYMPQDATKNDAIDLFKQELGGDPVYTSRAIELRQELDQEEFDKQMQEEQYRIDAEMAAQEIAESESGFDDLNDLEQDVASDFAEFAFGENGKQDDNAVRAGMRALGFTEDEINDELAKNSQAQRESEEIGAGRSQEGGAGRYGNGAQDAQAYERGSEKGFDLAGQTNSQAANQFAQQQAGESAEPTKAQADRERDAVPFSLGVQSQPKPQGVQTGLFTADRRVSVEAKPAEQKNETGLVGSRRDPAKVNIFNPYEDGDIVSIGGNDWQLRNDGGWYLTTTGNWRGEHPTIKKIAAMTNLIRAIEQEAVAKEEVAPAWHTKLPTKGLPITDDQRKPSGYGRVPNALADEAYAAITQNQLMNGMPMYAYYMPAANGLNGIVRLIPDDQNAAKPWVLLNGEAIRPAGQTKEQVVAKLTGWLRSAPVLGDDSFKPVEQSNPEPKKGDRFTDGEGNTWEIWNARSSLIEAHPVVDGKPVVNRDSGQRFATDDRAKSANPEARTDYNPIADSKTKEEPKPAEDGKPDNKAAKRNVGPKMAGDSGLGKATITPAKSLPFITDILSKENARQVTVKGGNADVLNQVANLFGKKIIFFRTVDAGRSENADVGAQAGRTGPDAGADGQGNRLPGSDFVTNGFVNSGRPDLVFLNVDSSNHLLYIVGHEVGHTLRMDDPALWSSMAKQLQPLIRRWSEYKANMGQKLDSDAAYAEELFGDIIGQNFLNQAFWNDLAKENQSLFKRIAQAAIKVLNKAMSLIVGQDVSIYVSDMEQARAIIAKTMAQYAEGSAKGIYAKYASQYDGEYVNKRMVAWHGSPHDHDKFDSSKIGTGEGAQAYGHGLYFAGRREVAEWYRDNLSSRKGANPTNEKFGGKTIMEWYQHWSDIADKSKDPTEFYDRMSMLEETELNWNPQAALNTAIEDELNQKAIDWFKATIADEMQRPGKTYQVELAPSEDEYLDWDKPLSEQSEKVQKALGIDPADAKRYAELSERLNELSWKEGGLDSKEWNKLVAEARAIRTKSPLDLTGGDFYAKTKNDLADKAAEGTSKAYYKNERWAKEASDYLHSIGIRGIRYLDGSSRGAGDGSRNYVIFNDADVSITAKYNVASQGKISPADKAIYGMAAEGKSAAEILKFIASASRSPFNRQVAKLLLKTGTNPTITVDDGKGWKMNAGDGHKYAAAYNPGTDTVALFRPASAERHALHELIHAATIKALSKKGLAAVQMRALFAHVQKNGKAVGLFYDQKTKRGIYGMADIDEFIAEAFSNPKFQALLKQVSAPKTPGGTLSSAWHWFSRIVRGILGLPMNTESALSRALDIGVGVMRENMKINEVISDGITRPSTDRSNPFSRIDEIAKVFERRVGEALSGGRVTGPILVADNTPASMQAFGWADRKVVINLKELQKIAAKPGFETDKAIASIVHDLRRPALMFWNTKNKSINYLRPGKMNMMIGVAPDAEMRNDKDAHLVLTAHLLDRADEQALRNKIERGELVLIYKGREVLGISGLAEKKLPQFNGLLAHGLLHARAADTEAKFKILRESDLVKWEADNWGNGIRYNVADEGWSVSEPSKMDDVIYSLQDKHIDMKRVVQSIFKTGKKVRDEVNAYLQEELFHGRAAKGVKDFLDFELRPLLQEMMRNKIDMGDFEEYLWNAHAQERNEQIAKVNPEMNDGGSGIKTADAKAYLSGIGAERKQIFESLAAKVDAMNRNSQKVLVESGLEKQETIDAWNGAYKHYVPLQREDVDSGHIGTGKGFSIRGSSTKRAMGSGRNVVDIIANLTMQRERNIVRAEKNRVSNALMGLAVENPNDDFWTVDKAPTDRVVEETAIYTVKDVSGEKLEEFTRMSEAERFAKQHPGSEIEQSWGDRVKERIMPGFKSRDNVLLTRVNGEDHYVIFNERDERAMRMALAMKNLDADNLGHVLSVVGKATRYLASINTQFNPVFGVINLIRDTQGALINLSSTPIAGDQKKVLGYTKDALIGIYKDIRAHRAGKKPSSDWAELFEEFQNEGGQTGYRDQYANAEQRAEAIQSELKQFKEGGAKRLVRGVFGWLSDYNETMENAVRLATYKAAKERGISKQQAASVAKSITVNFNRKGQVATQVGALYAFFNASVQGSARLAQTLFEQSDGDAKTIRLSKTGKKILAGGIMLGSMQALLLAAAGFDDDEPPEFIRERNLILPIGDGKYLTLAMPLGFHVIPGIGRIATEFVLAGGKDPIKRMASLFSMFAESFNPVGNAGFSLQTIAPSVVDPFAALAENKDFTGKEIYRENFNALNPTPGHARAKDVASVWSRYISEALNFITGGSEFRPGVFSPSPDAIDYLIGQATGGVGREVTKAGTTIGSAFTGEDLPMYKIPLVGRFVGDTEGQSGQSAKFYDAIKQINMHEAEYKGLISGGRSQEASDYLAENPAVKLIMLGNQTERVVRNLRSKKREMIDSEASQDSIKAIDERITETMARFNERVERVI